MAKGICIILVVAVHAPKVLFDSSWEKIVFESFWALAGSFYVPIFFLLSGIFETNSKQFQPYLKRILRLCKYIIVFWTWGILCWTPIYGEFDFAKGIWQGVGPVWFLHSLLFIEVLWCMMIMLTNNSFFKIASVIIMGGIGFALCKMHHNIYNLTSALLCFPFYAIGYYYKVWFKRHSVNYIVLAISFIIFLLAAFLDNKTEVISVGYIERNIVSFYMAAISGSVFIIELCKISNNRLLAFLGKNSLIIMMVHYSFQWVYYKHLSYIKIDSLLVYCIFIMAWVAISCCFIPLFRNKYYKIM